MNNGIPAGGRVIGASRPQMPEITVFPLAEVSVAPGGEGIGDATCHLKIVLPANGKELRIPYNAQSLRGLITVASRALEQMEGNHA